MDEFIDDAVRFPYGEKRTCLDTAKKLYRLAVLVRKEGLLALAEVAEREPDGVLKAAIVVLLAGLGEEPCLAERLGACLENGGFRGWEALNNRIIVASLLRIHGNIRPDLLAKLLGEWLAVDRSEICFDEESVRQ